MGIISAIGNSAEENLAALQQGRTGLSHTDYIDTIHKKSLLFGEIKYSNCDFEKLLNLPESNRFPRTAMLATFAAKQAVENAGITDINAYKTGFVSATSVGGMDMTELYFYEYEKNPAVQKYISSHNAGEVAHLTATYLGLKGLVTTISTACSSAANAIMFGARLIESGAMERVIVGGADALSLFTINGFNSLMILTDSVNTPFDQNRKGLNLGEGAAYLVLESKNLVKKQQKKVLAYLSGYGNANDAFHQTASSENGQGAFLAMHKALSVAKINPEDIDYINAHGTATVNNDLSEGRAFLRIFETNTPDFSSTKPFTGHTLAAAAAIEAVYSILALQNNTVFANKNFNTPMEEFDLIPQTEIKEKEITHVLSNSFGFGGNCSSLIFSKTK